MTDFDDAIALVQQLAVALPKLRERLEREKVEAAETSKRLAQEKAEHREMSAEAAAMKVEHARLHEERGWLRPEIEKLEKALSGGPTLTKFNERNARW
jgi:predicted nuclease with TOPRIM domain